MFFTSSRRHGVIVGHRSVDAFAGFPLHHLFLLLNFFYLIKKGRGGGEGPAPDHYRKKRNQWHHAYAQVYAGFPHRNYFITLMSSQYKGWEGRAALDHY